MLLANYALWPLAHIINFKFVPVQQRILYINCVQVRLLVACSAVKMQLLCIVLDKTASAPRQRQQRFQDHYDLLLHGPGTCLISCTMIMVCLHDAAALSNL